MKTILIIVITASIALIGSQQTFIRRRIPLGPRHILLTGTEFIFIGLLFGPSFLNLIDEKTIRILHPLLSFGLGWIGFLFGLQFDLSKVRFLPRHYFRITSTIASATIIVVFITFAFIFYGYLRYTIVNAWVLALVLAAVAACTGQSSMALVHRDYHIPSRGLMNLFRYIAAVDALFSILLCGLAISYQKASHIDFSLMYHVSAWGWFVVSLLAGGILGYVYHLLTYRKLTQDELLLVTIGLVLFASGIALYLELSPLVVTFAMGYVVANRSARNSRVIEIMIRSEKSVYILLVILAGASWSLGRSLPWLLVIAYLVIRALGKMLGGSIAAISIRTEFPLPKSMGLGLLSQGGVAIAILVNLQQVYHDVSINLIFTLIILAAIINELMSPWFVLKLLRTE